MTANDFHPVFQQDVYVIGPGGYQRINPAYCLSDKSAMELAELLSDFSPKIVQEFPLGKWRGGPFAQTHKVPFFELPDGTLINAGLEADYWNRGYGAETAERNARIDINGEIAYQSELRNRS